MTDTTTALKIGFVGLGKMGTPMSSRLAAGGFDVVGFDLSDTARTALTSAGGTAVESALDVAPGAGIVILMLPSSAVVRAVLQTGALDAALEPGTIVVDMSSSEPLVTRELAELLDARGVRLVDAPVSGGVSGAEKGTLTIMAGGAPDDIEAVRPVLEHLGKVRHVGPVGSGHALKAFNNLLSATHLWVTSEAIIAGAKFGLDPTVMLDAINGSSGRSGSTENKWPNFIVPETYNSGFGLRLMLKDMKIATDLSDQLGVPAVLGEEAVKLWTEAAEALPETADHTEIARWLMTRG